MEGKKNENTRNGSKNISGGNGTEEMETMEREWKNGDEKGAEKREKRVRRRRNRSGKSEAKDKSEQTVVKEWEMKFARGIIGNALGTKKRKRKNGNETIRYGKGGAEETEAKILEENWQRIVSEIKNGS